LDDNQLMIEVIAGETGRITPLYEKYKRPLFAYFFKLTGGDNQVSEDLVHTVFYRVLRYKCSFTGKGSFVSWLFRIAHNAGIDHNRKQKRFNNYKSEFQSDHPLSEEQNELEKQEQLAILELALNKLKPVERELLVLSKIDCLRYKEIAGILDISESNVKIRIFRSLKKLKDIYSKIENTGYEKARLQRKAI
jgi:RNA polymerase sigma factor (sigma-70 family)